MRALAAAGALVVSCSVLGACVAVDLVRLNSQVEQLYQERQMFVDKVLDQSGEELAKIGVIIDIINIQDIRDERGYLEALGVKRTSEVKRDAAIGKAQAERDAMKESETARREG